MAAKTVKASFPGHHLARPSSWTAPFVFSSPHSGRDYPARFLNDSVLDLLELRRSEDAYVDDLLPPPDIAGVPVLTARFPRAFVDVNRNSREIDASMFTASPVDGAEIRSNRVLAGFGVIPKFAAEGRAVYRRKLTAEEGRARLRWCYDPYHAVLADLLKECRDAFGTATLIDWHSMPSSAITGSHGLADIVLGDRYGAACDRALVDALQTAFEGEGLSVSRNSPYAGGHVTALLGRPRAGIHAIQVEINRALYLDESRVTRFPTRFGSLRDKLASAVATILQPYQTATRHAAE